MLELRGVNKSFQGNKALEGVTFTANPGEIHALMGQNGAGKSTLMKILSGAYRLDSGEILIDGTKVDIKNPNDAEHAGISLVYQELSVLPHLSVAANISINREKIGRLGLLNKKEIRSIASTSLARLGISINPNERMGNLSVSQQQLCEIAKALSKNPKIIVFDEPTSSLTVGEKEALFTVMKRMRDSGLTLIFITHHLEEVFAMADRCTILRDGKVVHSGNVTELDGNMLVQLMVGHKVDDFYPKRVGNPRSDVALELRGFGGNTVKPIDMKLHYGEILGMSGLIGAGRTELVRTIFGADHQTTGNLYKDGKRIHIRRPMDAIKHRIAYITEDRRIDGLTLNLSIKSNVSLVNIATGDRRLVNTMNFINKRGEKTLASQLIQSVQVKCNSSNDKVLNLSGGNQQKTAIAKWIATNADIYIFDEPTKGIDVASKVQVYKVLNQLADDGAAVLVISSYNPELIGICDRILVMANGELTEEFDSTPTEEELMLAQSK